MTTNDIQNGIQREITAAIDELQTGLERASRAVTTIRELLPRVNALGAIFDELEAVVRTGREQIGVAGMPSMAAQARPTLMNPTPGQQAPTFAAMQDAEATDEPSLPDSAAMPDFSGDLISFRIEFESAKAPLELRIIDEAVGEHPAVRDVALLDYDGRRATLKVWVDPATSPAAVEQALAEQLPDLIGEGGTITITPLDTAA